MKVWLVVQYYTYQESVEPNIVGIYSTLEQAKEQIKDQDNRSILEMTLNEESSPKEV